MDSRDFSGKQIGQYLLISLLGIGAAGSVYYAVDTTLINSPNYAIKCVPVSNVFKRHQQQLAEIANHDAVMLCPHVLTLYEALEKDNHLFLVLPLCEMDMFIAIKQRLYWRRDSLIKRVFVEVLDGVSAFHRKGVFHRDLKPENIMCSRRGTSIRIGDFGLSTNRRVCRDGGCGTVAYMSPECLRVDEVFYYADAADIWSLGVILFNMVTCLFPWEEATPRNRDYRTFLSHPDRFLHAYTISDSLRTLLRQIWHPIPMKRLSIPAIRQEILDMDTFYMPTRISCVFSPLLQKVVLVDSDKTCVTSVEDEKVKSTYVSVDVLEETFNLLNLRFEV